MVLIERSSYKDTGQRFLAKSAYCPYIGSWQLAIGNNSTHKFFRAIFYFTQILAMALWKSLKAGSNGSKNQNVVFIYRKGRNEHPMPLEIGQWCMLHSRNFLQHTMFFLSLRRTDFLSTAGNCIHKCQQLYKATWWVLTEWGMDGNGFKSPCLTLQ